MNTLLCLTAIADLLHDLNTSKNRAQAVEAIEQHFTTKPAKHIERWIRNYGVEFKALPTHSQLALLSRLNEKSIDSIATEYVLTTSVREQAQIWSAIRSIRQSLKTEKRFEQNMKLPTTAYITATIGSVLAGTTGFMYTKWLIKAPWSKIITESEYFVVFTALTYGAPIVGTAAFFITEKILKARITTKDNRLRKQSKNKLDAGLASNNWRDPSLEKGARKEAPSKSTQVFEKLHRSLSHPRVIKKLSKAKNPWVAKTILKGTHKTRGTGELKKAIHHLFRSDEFKSLPRAAQIAALQLAKKETRLEASQEGYRDEVNESEIRIGLDAIKPGGHTYRVVRATGTAVGLVVGLLAALVPDTSLEARLFLEPFFESAANKGQFTDLALATTFPAMGAATGWLITKLGNTTRKMLAILKIRKKLRNSNVDTDTHPHLLKSLEPIKGCRAYLSTILR